MALAVQAVPAHMRVGQEDITQIATLQVTMAAPLVFSQAEAVAAITIGVQVLQAATAALVKLL